MRLRGQKRVPRPPASSTAHVGIEALVAGRFLSATQKCTSLDHCASLIP